MSIFTIFFLALSLFFGKAIGQVSNTSFNDTLKTYDVFLEVNKTLWGGMEYKANGKLVSEENYNKYKMAWDATWACKPCNLVTLDAQDHIKHVAFQYQNCLAGDYKEFFSNGKLKTEGQFKKNPDERNWNNLSERGICNLRQGRWTFYSEDGSVQKVEFYENGTLLKIDDSKSSTQNATNDEKTDVIEKKPLGSKIKSKFQKKDAEEEEE